MERKKEGKTVTQRKIEFEYSKKRKTTKIVETAQIEFSVFVCLLIGIFID